MTNTRKLWVAASIAGLLVACGGSGTNTAGQAVAATPPYATVTVNTVTSPVVRGTSAIAVSATVTGTYDTNTDWVVVRPGECTDHLTPSEKSILTTVEQRTVYEGSVTGCSATNGTKTASLTLSGSTCSGTVDKDPALADGNQNVTVTANVSETVRVEERATTIHFTSNTCHGQVVGDPTTGDATTVSTTTKTGTGTGTKSYVLDVAQPTIAVTAFGPDGGANFAPVPQNGVLTVTARLTGGSSGTPFSVTVCATKDSDATKQYCTSGDYTFGGTVPDGIAPVKDVTLAISLVCAEPGTDYTVSASASTKDLAGAAFPTISANSSHKATITSIGDGDLTIQPVILAETVEDSEELAPIQCFSNWTNNGGHLVDNPGTVMVGAILKATGCSPQPFKNATVTMTLPYGFAFRDDGKSPRAHSFVGNPGSGFNYDEGDPLNQVTHFVPSTDRADITMPESVTIDFTGLNHGGVTGGSFAANQIIYIRAHAQVVEQSDVSFPYSFQFGASATALDGTTPLNVNTPVQIIYGNPDGVGDASVCSEGLLPDGWTPAP